jgi:hypothetical protein
LINALQRDRDVEAKKMRERPRVRFGCGGAERHIQVA